jgi:hypothetical protein
MWAKVIPRRMSGMRRPEMRNAVNTSSVNWRTALSNEASPRLAAIAKLLSDDDVGSTELQRTLFNFLAASAERENGSNNRRYDDNAFQTLHGLLSSGSNGMEAAVSS